MNFGFTVSKGRAARVFSHKSSSTRETQHTARLRLEGAQWARLTRTETISRELTSRTLASTLGDILGPCDALSLGAGAGLAGQLALSVLIGSWRTYHTLFLFSAVERSYTAADTLPVGEDLSYTACLISL